MRKTILFICTHNSSRSQMAEGFVKALYSDKYKAHSAGIEPYSINLYAVRVMKEIGIDISNQRAKSINEFRGQIFDYVITVCDNARETCPFFPGKKIIHKGFQDPASIEGTEEEKLAVFRKVRDEIKHWIIETFGKTEI
ncbi:MAG: arsenate reductase ArsC [bacterium]